MKISKKIGPSLLLAVIFASLITPHASAATPAYDISSVGVSVGDILVYSIYGQGTYGYRNGFKINVSITSIVFNTLKYVDNDVVEINGSLGEFNCSKGYWEEIVSDYTVNEWNGTYFNYSAPMEALHLIPKPINFTWLNLSFVNSGIDPIDDVSGATINMTVSMGKYYMLSTFSTMGVLIQMRLYNTTNDLLLQFTLDVAGSSIPFGEFFLGVSAAAIIGVIAIMIKRHKVRIKT